MRNFLILLLGLAPLSLVAQTKNALWLGAEYDAGAFEMTYQSRSNMDFTNARQLVEMSQRLFRKKNFNGKILLRGELDEGEMSIRFGFDLSYSSDIKSSPLEVQLRFRSTLEKPLTNRVERTFRLKNRWLYDFGKHEPYVLWEYYHPVAATVYEPRLRLETGYTFKMKGPFSWSIFYRNHLDFTEIGDEHTAIYGFGFGFKP